MLYLLHFDPPVGTAQHYLGYTKEDGLKARLTRHMRGQGASLTRRAFELGCEVYLARTFPDQTPAIERQLKKAGHMKRQCPLCCDLLSRLKSDVYRLDPTRPEQPPQRALLAWKVPIPSSPSHK